jgi:hypothetical protein
VTITRGFSAAAATGESSANTASASAGKSLDLIPSLPHSWFGYDLRAETPNVVTA